MHRARVHENCTRRLVTRNDARNEPRLTLPPPLVNRYCDAFVERDNLYIVMEFAEHGDVGRQIEKFKKANKYIKEDTIWSYAIQIAQVRMKAAREKTEAGFSAKAQQQFA